MRRVRRAVHWVAGFDPLLFAIIAIAAGLVAMAGFLFYLLAVA